MKIIVTGGAGFIGSNFVHHMVNKYPDYEIINLDLLTYAGNLENLKPVENKPNYRFVKGDIADRKFIFDLFEKEKPDVVVNFAAESHVDRSITDPEAFVRTNVMGTTTLLDACRTYGIKQSGRMGKREQPQDQSCRYARIYLQNCEEDEGIGKAQSQIHQGCNEQTGRHQSLDNNKGAFRISQTYKSILLLQKAEEQAQSNTDNSSYLPRPAAATARSSPVSWRPAPTRMKNQQRARIERCLERRSR